MFDKLEFNALLARKGMKKMDLARLMGISYTSLYRKIETGRFTREEISRIIDILEIDDPRPIFFSSILT